MLKENEITILSLHLGYGGIEQYLSSLCKMLDDDYQISLKILFLKYYLNIKAIKQIDSKYIITTRDFHNKLVGKYAKKEIIKIATEHNYHNNDDNYIGKLVSSVKNFNYFVLVSETLTNFYQKLVKPKCIYIPNIIDALPSNKTSLTDNVIVSIGRMEKEKGFDDLIDIVSLLKKDIPSIKLYLMGDGSLKESLFMKVKDLKLTDNIIFTGFIPKDEMAQYLTKAKLYVMTSHTESFGLVLLEAMSYGIPCIAFDSADGAKELLKNNTGILVPNRDKGIMSEEIIKLLNDDNKLKNLSKISREYVMNYLPDKVKDKWLNILK